MVFVTCPRLDESIAILRNAWKNIFYKSKKFASLFFNHIFMKEKITILWTGDIGLPYLIINELYFVTGICQTTWSNSSYQEYLQISLRCSSCRYHSLRTCVASFRKSTLISRRVWNVTLSETMKVVKLNRYEYFYLIYLYYVIIQKNCNDNGYNNSYYMQTMGHLKLVFPLL